MKSPESKTKKRRVTNVIRNSGDRENMQTIVQVICSNGKSLRDVIVNDAKLVDFDLQVQAQHKKGRSNGWAKIDSSLPDRQGAINVAWDPASRILSGRIVNKAKGRPDHLLGDFVAYLFARHRKRIRSVNIINAGK
jgi:hypothetical protein